jgi:hypothetical protein
MDLERDIGVGAIFGIFGNLRQSEPRCAMAAFIFSIMGCRFSDHSRIFCMPDSVSRSSHRSDLVVLRAHNYLAAFSESEEQAEELRFDL